MGNGLNRLIGMYACMYDCVCVSMYIWCLNGECLSFVFSQIFRSQDYNAVYYCMKEVIF